MNNVFKLTSVSIRAILFYFCLNLGACACGIDKNNGICGDGTVDAGEECDDSNTTNGDGCDTNCQIENLGICGDGTVDAGEECDDGNVNNQDGCDFNCQIEPFCGDGTVDAGEECDDGNAQKGDGCDLRCQLEDSCGDGIIAEGEFCGELVLAAEAIGANPTSISIGDLDGDGTKDFVSSSFSSGEVLVFLATGKGQFSLSGKFSTRGGPLTADLGDVDGDGDLDIVTANVSAEEIALLRNDGNGNFSVPSFFPVTQDLQPVSVFLEDVDQDQDLDLFVCNNGFSNAPEGNVQIFTNQNGSFVSSSEIAVPCLAMDVGDLNNDGRPDFVSVESDLLHVALNDGTGGFQVLPPIPTNPINFPFEISIAGDLNGDSLFDLAVVGDGNDAVLFLNQGNGSFLIQVDAQGVPVTHALGNVSDKIKGADANGDGLIDLFSVSRDAGTLEVLVNQGNLQFALQQFDTDGLGSIFLDIDDLDTDGDLDVVTANTTSNDISVLSNDGTGQFATQNRFDLGDPPTQVLSGDVDNDGDLDLISLSEISNSINISLNQGNGTMIPVEENIPLVGLRIPDKIAVGDLDGDSFLDIIALDIVTLGGGFPLFLGNGDGTFAAPILIAELEADARIPRDILIQDIDSDGDQDIAFVDGDSIDFLLNVGNLNFISRISFTNLVLQEQGRSLALGDLNQDGTLDVVSAGTFNNLIRIVLQDSNQSLSDPIEIPIENLEIFPQDMELADLDQDGDLDIVMVGIGTNIVAIFRHEGVLDFVFQETLPVDFPRSIALADLDQDGDIDISIGKRGSLDNSIDELTLLFNDGTGRFPEEKNFQIGSTIVNSPHPVDLNGDGAVDLAFDNFLLAEPSLLLSAP